VGSLTVSWTYQKHRCLHFAIDLLIKVLGGRFYLFYLFIYLFFVRCPLPCKGPRLRVPPVRPHRDFLRRWALDSSPAFRGGRQPRASSGEAGDIARLSKKKKNKTFWQFKNFNAHPTLPGKVAGEWENHFSTNSTQRRDPSRTSTECPGTGDVGHYRPWSAGNWQVLPTLPSPSQAAWDGDSRVGPSPAWGMRDGYILLA
jgi:hypothetical protein